MITAYAHAAQSGLERTIGQILPPHDFWQSPQYGAALARLRLAERFQNSFERLDQEHRELSAAQSWLAAQPGPDAAELRISYIETLAPYLQRRGMPRELVRWCDDGLRACATLGRNSAWVWLLRAQALNALGQWDESFASMQAAINASEGEDAGAYAHAVLALGTLQLNRGDYPSALQNLRRARSLLEALDDHEGVAAARSEVAAYHLNRRELDRALALYLEVDRLRRRTAPESSNHTLLMLGVVYRKKRNYVQAAAKLTRLLERGESQGDRGAVATAAHHLAWMYFELEDLYQARRYCGRSIWLYRKIGDPRGLSDAYEQLGLIHLAEGEVEAALSYLQRSLSLRRQLDNRQGTASALRRLAVAQLKSGRVRDGSSALWQSLAMYQQLGMLSYPQLTNIFSQTLWWISRRWRPL